MRGTAHDDGAGGRALYRAKEKGRNRLEVTACEAAAAVSEGEQQAARARLMRRQEVAA